MTGASKDGTVDTHFGHARQFLIFDVAGDTYRFTESRAIDSVGDKPDIIGAIKLIADCKYVITAKAGPHAAIELKAGIEVIEACSSVDVAMNRMVKYFMK